MTRLHLLGLLALWPACGGDGAASDAGPPDAATVDAPTYDPLEGIGTVELVAGGFQFVEGPQWIAERGHLLFSDINGDTIYELTPPSTVEPFRMPSGNSNGLALTPDGDLLAAEHGNRRVSVAMVGAAATTLVDHYGADRLNSPNDVIVHDGGTVYFTDPPYGINDADRELDFVGVFRIAPGDDPEIVWSGSLTQRPNGIALSPDQDVLYVADTVDGVVRAFEVAADGTTGEATTLSTDTPLADGLAVDAAGNLFVTTGAGIRVIAPDGTTWGTIAVPQQPANCAFGGADGRTLYITARTAVYRVSLAHPGIY